MIKEANVIEVKSVVDELTKKLVKVLNADSLYAKVTSELRSKYNAGLDETGLTLSMNFLQDDERIKLLEDYTFENIRGMNEELAEKLRKELQQGLMNFESTSQLKERVQKALKVAEERAALIARTEMVRARNMGALDGARQSGLKLKKEWSSAGGDECPACKSLDGKKVDLDAQFSTKDGQTALQPPLHPNCKCTLLFIQV